MYFPIQNVVTLLQSWHIHVSVSSRKTVTPVQALRWPALNSAAFSECSSELSLCFGLTQFWLINIYWQLSGVRAETQRHAVGSHRDKLEFRTTYSSHDARILRRVS